MSSSAIRFLKVSRARQISKLLCSASFGAAALIAVSTSAQAQNADRHWDANSTTPGAGGTGAWDTSSLRWSTTADGAGGLYDHPWDNIQLDNAIFGGTAGTVTLGGPITVHNITFNTTLYSITGNTLTLAGITPTITVNSGTSTISSILAGNAGLTKSGAGGLTLSGLNTFSGGVALNGGTLTATDAALGAASNNIAVLGDSTLNITATSGRTVNVASGVTLRLNGPTTGSALYTGAGNLNLLTGVRMTNDANSYTGTTTFNGAGGGSGAIFFSSIRNLGEASSLGAPTTVADGTITFQGGTQYSDRVLYTGTGDNSNRNWVMSASNTTRRLINQGSGTLSITGDISVTANGGAQFEATLADIELLGVISGTPNISFFSGATTAIRLGGANSYTGLTTISGGVVSVSALANAGTASSLGTGTNVNLSGGILSYTGVGASSDRIWLANGASGIRNDGTGALTLTGNLDFNPAAPADSLTLGGSYVAGVNDFNGILAGVGNLAMDGAGTWRLTGANTRIGTLSVSSGILRAGNASAFGTVTGLAVTGGTLDLGGFDLEAPTISGNGTIALGTGNLTIRNTTAQTFGGNITGSGDLIKRGSGALTLTGQSSYTGTTNVINGALRLDYSAAAAPTNLISSASTLDMGGGALTLIGKAGALNSQTFNGLTISGGNNIISATSGAGGDMAVNFGAINRTTGLVNFVLPTSGNFTTSNTSLGPWATVNGSDYATVSGGNIVAFTGYVNKDDASQWVNGDIVSDEGNAANSPYFGTLASNVALGGIKYTAAADSAVSLGGNTLSIEGTILVSPTVGTFNQTIGSGNITGGAGGGTLGIQQNGGGTTFINATIVDNGGATGFAKAGTGRVTLGGINSYTGGTTVSQGTLTVGTIGDGGVASAVGASSSDAANLVIEGATLQYNGGTTTSDRGFTLLTNGPTTAGTIDVTLAPTDLTFSGLVTSPDGAGLTKSGAGTLTLAGVGNNYGGVTTVIGGTLAVSTLADGGVVSSIGVSDSASSNLVLQTSGTLNYLGDTTSTNRGFTLGPGVGGIGVNNAASVLTISGVATGAGGLNKTGAGTLILSGANTYTGATAVQAGTLQAGSASAFGTGAMTVATGATLDLAGFGATVAGMNGGGQLNLGSALLTTSNTGTFSGTISGTGGLTHTAGVQTLSGCANTYTGATRITAGVLSVGCLRDGGVASDIGASTSASSNLVISDSGTLLYTGGTQTTNRGFTLENSWGYVQVGQADTTLEFTGIVGGAGHLIKRGDGTLVLSGNNSFTGQTRVEAGRLVAGSSGAFDQGTATLLMSNVAGAVFDAQNYNVSFLNLAGGGALGGNIEIDGGTLTVTNGSNQTYSGIISGTGSFVKSGGPNAAQTLAGCGSSYTGTTTVSSGWLDVACLTNGLQNSSIGSSTNASSNLILNGGTLRYVGTGGTTDRMFTLGASATSGLASSGTGAIAFTNTGAIAFSDPNTVQTVTLGGTNTGNNTLAALITNNGTGATSLRKADAGTWILTNQSSSYTGVTTINGGVLGVDKLANGGVVSSIGASTAAASNLIIGNGSTLRYTGAGDTTNRLFTLSSGVTFIESSGTGSIVFTDTGPVTLQTNNAARIIALGGTNTGNNTLAGSIGNAGTGITTLAKSDAGTWYLTGTNSYSGPTNINAGTLFIGAGGTMGSITSNTVNVTGLGALGFNRSDTVTYAGTIQGSGGVTQAGTGTTILTGTNTYTGGTTISAGTLQLGNGGTTGDIAGDIVNNGTLTFNRSDSVIINDFRTISGTGAVRQIGSGSTSLEGTNSYSGGTSITGGTLRVQTDASLGAASGELTINGGTLVSITSFTSDRAITLAGAGTISPNFGTTLTLTGEVSGSGALTKTGASTLVLTANNTYAGGTTISGGTLQIGNGGVTGGIAGNVLNNGALVVNRSGSLTLGGTILGGGSFTQSGPGTTILTGANTYAGATSVNAGTLLVNGNQSGATGLISIASGATLGGVGTIGGNVAIADGGALAAGSNGVGALTINGNLALGNTSQLNFEFGQANVPGGPLNDLVNVGGNLTFDGVVNVTQTAGGSFGPGVYRMFNYSGTLTDNGATLGALPGGSAGFIQTALANQVNLVNTAGLTLNFWDGAGGPKNDGTIQGGNGTWRVSGGENNWTDANGAVNADYAQDSFAIFQGTGGTVTVDNSGGNVSTAGMQFTADGYVIAGGPLTLTGTQTLIRVGDGTPADAGLTTTIEAALTGATQLVKTDGGTLVLTGTNSYNNGTTIDAGTLELGDGGTSGNILGDVVINSGALVFNRSDDVIFSGAISGAGDITQRGAGATILTGNSNLTGGVYVNGGTLQVSDGSVVNLDRVVNGDGSVSSFVGIDTNLIVTGAGSAFTTSNDLIVGRGAGTASITVDNGGQLTADRSFLGEGSNVSTASAINVIVNGVGSIFNAGSYFHLGAAAGGTASLTISGGGAMQTVPGGKGSIGRGGDGSALVTGVGSQLLSDNVLYIGESFNGGAGHGQLTIQDGGLVTASMVAMGYNDAVTGGSTGALTILGTAGSRGTIETGALSRGFGDASITFDGGLLRATADNANYIDNMGADELVVTLGSGGGFIDTNGHAIGIAPRFDGVGGLTKQSAGILTLSGANSYLGATNVSAGTLFINGDQSLATGATSVATGATLGGIGIIGGDVTVAGGATLAPGDVAGPGTLTINGSLALAGASRLDYQFGQSNVVGGPLNDLTKVGGDLALDGTIDVTVSPGGSFDLGLYRVISYGGTLTDNGLALGTLPFGTVATVQTSVAGQVNLINATGTTLDFWDGAALANKTDGLVNGGNGTWQNSSGNDNWTELTGTVNGTYTDASFAIFAAAPGTVSVDNSLGAVAASGMQFASDGYTVTGQDLTLVGPQSIIRVGDGTADGLGYTAIIESALIGNSQLVKRDLGTLVLTGTNSYTGGTRIDVGTLRISSDANLGAAAGSLSFDGGTLYTTANITTGRNVDLISTGTFVTDAGTSLVFTGALSGAGNLVKDGAGTLALNDTSNHSGTTSVLAGSLFVNGDQSAALGLTSVASGSTLGGSGIIGGDVVVAAGGTLAPGNSPGTLTINGALALDAGSVLNFEFGQANVAGGSLNDLVNVGGDLTLDGMINVAVSTGGTFGPGIYRVFNYGGTLTNNGLALGALPGGSEVSVQTAITGQVNLVNTAGLTLRFWDGTAGPKNNAAIDGGSGVWRLNDGSSNWADVNGIVNADYAQDSFAVFSGAPGTVTLDNTGGNVLASGLQFASNGYTITGDALTLTGVQAIVQVGDSSMAGAGYTATIDAALAGSAALVKTDAGMLVLTGTNSYTGGTVVSGGTLRISSDSNLGDAAGSLSLGGGTINNAADISTARAVGLTGGGSFLTDAATTLTLGGTVSGAGSLTKDGAGVLVLSGTGTHTGATNVDAGTLLVNGDYVGALGATAVAAGASLGGTGTIGGNVALADDAILTPGAGGAGTLTINGGLSLSSGSRLAFEFGQANTAGGALNDLVNVGGDLVLDGTIDVTVPTGGAFDVGVYRVFNYGGILTNGGLTVGTLPGGASASVQTSIAGQVNLVNTGGLTLGFWDGAAGPKNNNVVNGGSGTWQNGSGNDNWTDANGTLNAAFSDGTFAVFGGTAGTVTVDNSLGDVTASGMQFASNGYTITGDPVGLTGPQSIIRVGDGSAAGAGFAATINAVLTGNTQLVKTDAGTLVLGGTNSYTSGTAINGGTVQVSADANLGAASGGVTLDGGTLATSASMTSARGIVMAGAGTISTGGDTTFTYAGRVSGTGTLTKAGTGTLLVTGDNSGFVGTTMVSSGTLAVTGALGGALEVNSAGRLEGTGTVGNVTNAGIVAPGRGGFGTLTITGSYASSGGTLEIEAALGGDSSQADRLVVANGTSGTNAINVINRGGLGAQTVEGIKIVDVTGGASAGTFTLNGDYVFEGDQAVIAGAYSYRLYQGGVASPTDGDWYLRSALLNPANEPVGPLYQPGVPLYESYAATLQTLNRLGTLQERVGNRQWSGFTQGGVGMWGRIESTRYRPEAVFSTSGTDLDVNDWSLQAGFDKALVDNAEDTIIAGVNARYGKADATVRSRFGSGSLDTRGYGLGATLTWYDSTGFYADAQAQLSWYRSDLASGVLGKLVDNNHGSGEAFSIEAGKRAPLGGALSVTPQIQMTYSSVRFDRFEDPNGATVSSDQAHSLKSRGGISLDHQKSWDASSGTRQSHIYGIVNLSYEWLDGTVTDVSGTPIARRDNRLWGEVGVGGSYSWADGKFTLFSEISANTAIHNFGDSNNLKGNAGFRMRF